MCFCVRWEIAIMGMPKIKHKPSRRPPNRETVAEMVEFVRLVADKHHRNFTQEGHKARKILAELEEG